MCLLSISLSIFSLYYLNEWYSTSSKVCITLLSLLIICFEIGIGGCSFKVIANYFMSNISIKMGDSLKIGAVIVVINNIKHSQNHRGKQNSVFYLKRK